VNGNLDSDSRPSSTELFGYPAGSVGRVDYVLLWGLDENGRHNRVPSKLRNQLADGYDLIYTSTDRRLLQLYRRKGYSAALGS